MKTTAFTIANDLLAACPEIHLGILTSSVRIEKSSDSLWNEVEHVSATARASLTGKVLQEDVEIQALREVYKTLGKDPSRYRGSAESLLRRLLQGKSLYRINNMVEINNTISVESRCAV